MILSTFLLNYSISYYHIDQSTNYDIYPEVHPQMNNLKHLLILDTHAMLYISQIDQKVDAEWPLTVIDHNGRKDKVYLKKGEMVLYESAKVMHGRQFHLDGDFFENLFIHFTIEKDYAKYQAILEETWVKRL